MPTGHWIMKPLRPSMMLALFLMEELWLMPNSTPMMPASGLQVLWQSSPGGTLGMNWHIATSTPRRLALSLLLPWWVSLIQPLNPVPSHQEAQTDSSPYTDTVKFKVCPAGFLAHFHSLSGIFALLQYRQVHLTSGAISWQYSTQGSLCTGKRLWQKEDKQIHCFLHC